MSQRANPLLLNEIRHQVLGRTSPDFIAVAAFLVQLKHPALPVELLYFITFDSSIIHTEFMSRFFISIILESGSTYFELSLSTDGRLTLRNQTTTQIATFEPEEFIELARGKNSILRNQLEIFY